MSRATLLSSTSGRAVPAAFHLSFLAGDVCRDPVPKKSQVPGLEHISLKGHYGASQSLGSETQQRPDEMVAAVTSVRQLRKRGSERLSS